MSCIRADVVALSMFISVPIVEMYLYLYLIQWDVFSYSMADPILYRLLGATVLVGSTFGVFLLATAGVSFLWGQGLMRTRRS